MTDWDMNRDWGLGAEDHPTGRQLGDYAEQLDKIGDMLTLFDNMPAVLRDWLAENDLDIEELERAFSDVSLELDTLAGRGREGGLFGCDDSACDNPLAPIAAQCPCGALLCRECAEWNADADGNPLCSDCARKA